MATGADPTSSPRLASVGNIHHFTGGVGADGDNRHDFTFHAERRLRREEGDSYRPGEPDSRRERPRDERRERGMEGHSDRSRMRYDLRDRGRSSGSWGGRGGRGGQSGERKPWAPIPAHSRPMMLYRRQKTPEQLAGMVSGGMIIEGDEGTEGEASDAEEGSAQMDLDDGSEHKAAGGEGPSIPPNPLTEDIQEGDEVVKAEKAKMDVIAMIRKAKAKPSASAPAATRNEIAANDDFISFGFSDDEKPQSDKGVDEDHGRKSRRANDGSRVDGPPPSAPSAPRGFSHRDGFHKFLDEVVSPPRLPPTFSLPEKPPRLPPMFSLPEKPPPPARGVDYGPPGAGGSIIIPAALPPPPGLSTLPIGGPVPPVTGGVNFSLPQKIPTGPAFTPLNQPRTSKGNRNDDHISIGSSSPPQSPHGRKRKRDEIKEPPSPFSRIARGYSFPRNRPGNPAPWLIHDHTHTLHMSDLLHKEIHDFISYIRPRRYEHALRRHVIHRIRSAITTGFRDVDVLVFGSFASEMYLPTSDLDLAILSHDFARIGEPKYNTKKSLMRVATLLKNKKIPKDNQVAIIANATVPIVKFVDAETGLQVDICFENLSGVTANRTFREWREKYPAMPPLVMVLKQFLEMRKLNEVYQGGLGGFSVICLVVSLLQMHPGFQTGNVKPTENLGLALLEFLRLYGKLFDTSRVGIDVLSQCYFWKQSEVPFQPKLARTKSANDYYLLHIVDPNDASNNISKSSFGIRDVFGAFGSAFESLERRMQEVHTMGFDERKAKWAGNNKGGLLGALVGGNYEAIEKQRKVMRRVYEDVFGEAAKEDELYVYSDAEWDDGNPHDGGWRWKWGDGTHDGMSDTGGKGWIVDVKGVGAPEKPPSEHTGDTTESDGEHHGEDNAGRGKKKKRRHASTLPQRKLHNYEGQSPPRLNRKQRKNLKKRNAGDGDTVGAVSGGDGNARASGAGGGDDTDDTYPPPSRGFKNKRARQQKFAAESAGEGGSRGDGGSRGRGGGGGRGGRGG